MAELTITSQDLERKPEIFLTKFNKYVCASLNGNGKPIERTEEGNAIGLMLEIIREQKAYKDSTTLKEVIEKAADQRKKSTSNDEEELIKILKMRLDAGKNHYKRKITPEKGAILGSKFTELFDKLDSLIEQAKDGKELTVDVVNEKITDKFIKQNGHVAAQTSRIPSTREK